MLKSSISIPANVSALIRGDATDCRNLMKTVVNANVCSLSHEKRGLVFERVAPVPVQEPKTPLTLVAAVQQQASPVEAGQIQPNPVALVLTQKREEMVPQSAAVLVPIQKQEKMIPQRAVVPAPIQKQEETTPSPSLPQADPVEGNPANLGAAILATTLTTGTQGPGAVNPEAAAHLVPVGVNLEEAGHLVPVGVNLEEAGRLAPVGDVVMTPLVVGEGYLS